MIWCWALAYRVRMNTYTAERKDVLGCASLTTERSRVPRDISRAEGNLEVGGGVQPSASWFEAVYGHSLIINPSLGICQEIHPCGVSSMYNVKINTSLPTMRECCILMLSQMLVVNSRNSIQTQSMQVCGCMLPMKLRKISRAFLLAFSFSISSNIKMYMYCIEPIDSDWLEKLSNALSLWSFPTERVSCPCL